ncbi:MAG: hypothetical protein JWP69_28 [Flaviaesturariibacter sp.]|nr:hypothetical protein [Flaviaesturariibacter sp.]
MKYLFLIVSIITLTIACSKDKFQTKPSLEIVSTSSKEVPINGSFEVTFEYTDKQGDLSDSIFVRKIRTNRRVTATVAARDSLWYKLPAFPNSPKGEVVLRLGYTNLQAAQVPPSIPNTVPPRKESDSLTFKFVIQDKEKNKSDTVTLTGVVVERN